jgi:hypothetical protein
MALGLIAAMIAAMSDLREKISMLLLISERLGTAVEAL